MRSKLKPTLVISKKFLNLLQILFLVTLTITIACSKVESKTREGNLQGTVAENYPLLSSTPLASATFTKLPNDLLLRSVDITITKQEIDNDLAQTRANIREQLQDNVFFILEQKFTEKVILQESRNSLTKDGHDITNISDMDVIQTFVYGLVKDIEPSEAEINEFYEANKALMGDMPFDQVRGQIVGFLKQQQQQEYVQEYITNILSNRKVEISGSWAAEKISLAMNNDVDQARLSSIPTMANFGSDSCVPCQMMIPAREAVRESFGDTAHVVYVHTDRDQILSSRYGIQSIPTLIFFDKQGAEVHRHVGIMSQDEMEEWLNRLLRD
ncbi:MAG: thioredoxin family protein [Candidatus Cloacimonetes bacterium]|nr:thioredoxin family protein [Candidatus Cloacimonadota bacterium]